MPLDPLLINWSFLLLSLLIIFKAADLIVYGISRYAKVLRLSDALIGFVVVAFAASMPEVIAAIMGLIAGKEEVLFGTILGTNMVHVALVVGTLACVAKRLPLECKIIRGRIFVLWLLLMLPFVLIMWDGELGRLDGAVLIAAFVAYLVGLWVREGTLGHVRKSVRVRTIWRDVFIFLGSLVALILAGRFLVFSSINIAALVGIPAYFIAITIISISGAIPDFAVGIRSVLKGHADIGTGDIIGSIALELLLFFGIVGLISPIQIAVSEIFYAVIFLAVSLSFIMFLVSRRSMSWKHGALLLMLYAVFLGLEIAKLV